MEEEEGSSDVIALVITLAIILGTIGIFVGVYVALRYHYTWQRKENEILVLEAEEFLRKALLKVEEESCSIFKEDQTVR